jgi:pimeloyl-ACP methyl ester carboxylesterase
VATFALVHGAWHGPWCWELLTPELIRRGHRVVAPDLPADQPSATLETYAEIVGAALEGVGGDDVILVGHSLGGSTIPLVAHHIPVRRLVYLCALIPEPGHSLTEQIQGGDMVNGTYLSGLSGLDSEGCRSWTDPGLARRAFYQDCPDRVAEASVSRLRRQAWTPYRQRFPLDQFPAVAATSIICAGDQMVWPDWSRSVSHERLGADVLELPGGHSPFLSRPRILAEVLSRIADEVTLSDAGR